MGRYVHKMSLQVNPKNYKWYKLFWSLFLLRIYNIVPTMKYIKLGFLFKLFGIRVCMKAQCNSRNVPLKLWLPIWMFRIKTSFIIWSLTSSDLALHKVWFWSDFIYILKKPQYYIFMLGILLYALESENNFFLKVSVFMFV